MINILLFTADPVNKSDCITFVNEFTDPSVHIAVIVSFALLYATIFVLGLAGNLSVIWLTARNSRLQSVQNFFILNLAASDLLMCIFSLPITPITNIYKNWVFGSAMCHSLPWIQGVSVFVATFSLAAIAIDRYFMILLPHAPVRKRLAKMVMVLLWILSIIFTLPYSISMEVVKVDGFCGDFCTENWPNDDFQRIYTTFVLIVQYVIPFTIMFYCYFKIFGQLQERTKAKIKKYNERNLILVASAGIMSAVGHSIPSNEIVEQVLEPRTDPADEVKIDVINTIRKKSELLAKARRNTFILVSMVLVFGISWLPHNLVSMLIDIVDRAVIDKNGTNWAYLINLITHSTAMISIVANPILYGLLNPEFVCILKKTCSDWKLTMMSVSLRRRLEPQSSNSTFL